MIGNPHPGDLRRALGGGVLTLDVEDIRRLLPHEPPMLMVDKVLTLSPGRHGVGIKAVSGNEYGLHTLRHGFVFPSTLALEGLAQLAALVLICPENGVIPKDDAPRARGSIAAIRSLEMHREMTEAEIIHLDINIAKRLDPYVRVEGEASIGGDRYVNAVFDLAVSLET